MGWKDGDQASKLHHWSDNMCVWLIRHIQHAYISTMSHVLLQVVIGKIFNALTIWIPAEERQGATRDRWQGNLSGDLNCHKETQTMDFYLLVYTSDWHNEKVCRYNPLSCMNVHVYLSVSWWKGSKFRTRVCFKHNKPRSMSNLRM